MALRQSSLSVSSVTSPSAEQNAWLCCESCARRLASCWWASLKVSAANWLTASALVVLALEESDAASVLVDSSAVPSRVMAEVISARGEGLRVKGFIGMAAEVKVSRDMSRDSLSERHARRKSGACQSRLAGRG